MSLFILSQIFCLSFAWQVRNLEAELNEVSPIKSAQSYTRSGKWGLKSRIARMS